METDKLRKKFIQFCKDLMPYVAIIIIVLLFRAFIATPVRVDGDSMNPTLENGEILLLNKMDKTYERFNIIVFNYNDTKLVKRIIGLPGDTVKYVDNQLYINDELVEETFDHRMTLDYTLEKVIPEGKYFVLGDNRTDSLDSRIIGLIDENDIDGVISFSIFPPKTIK
jgi:signal peptidase I